MEEASQRFVEQLKCILHVGEDKKCEPVKKFSIELLNTCKKKSVVYKFRDNSDYKNIVIPTTVTDSTGYHSSCYKKYTAVRNQEVESALEKQKALDEQSVSSQSAIQPTDNLNSGNQ